MKERGTKHHWHCWFCLFDSTPFLSTLCAQGYNSAVTLQPARLIAACVCSLQGLVILSLVTVPVDFRRAAPMSTSGLGVAILPYDAAVLGSLFLLITHKRSTRDSQKSVERTSWRKVFLGHRQGLLGRW